VTWLGYFASSIQVDRNITNPNNVSWVDFNVSVASSFAATAFLSLTELNGTTPVKQLSFSSLGFTYNATASDLMTNKTAGLYAFVFNSLSVAPKIELQYIITEVAGVINVLTGVPVYPKAVESIMIIDGWNYVSLENRLSLRIAVGSAQSSWSADGQITAGSGDSLVYFHLAKTVEADGKLTPVEFAGSIIGNLDTAFANPYVVAQLRSRYQASAMCRIIDILIPPGANHIVYDPTMGAGQSPFSPQDSDGNYWIIIASVLAVVVFVAAVVILIVLYRRRKSEYATIG